MLSHVGVEEAGGTESDAWEGNYTWVDEKVGETPFEMNVFGFLSLQ